MEKRTAVYCRTIEEYDAQFKVKDSCLFVKGQWYKGNNNTYMKFSHLENRGSYNELYYTEKIYCGHYEPVNDFWANNDMEKHALEYPLERVMDEIQPFLPEGHEDKVVKVSSKEPVYIAGKWYKLNNCWYAKCSKDSFDKETFYGNESYNSDGEHDDIEFVTTLEEQNSIVELTESIIDHKTPIELKSIILNNMKDTTKPEPKYKVGDKLESCEGGWQYDELGLELEGAISTIKSNYNNFRGVCTKIIWSNTHQTWWYKIGDYGNMFTESGVKLAEYKGYKIGDAVIVKNKPINWSSALNNNCPLYGKYPIIGIIKGIEYGGDDSCHYAMDMGGYGWSLTHLIDTNNISKIEDLTEYAGLKVGDVLKESDINEWRKIGENYEFGGVWKKSSSTFHGDRKIDSFKLINGVVGFKVSGATNVYLRADGYLDFIKSKNTEKDDSTLEPASIEANISNKFDDNIIPIPSGCPFKEGDSVSCIIYDTPVEDGKIHFEDENIYICQNEMNGLDCKNKLGYLYSWVIYLPEYSANFTSGLKYNQIKNLKLKEVLNDIKEEDYSQKTLNLLKKQITII